MPNELKKPEPKKEQQEPKVVDTKQDWVKIGVNTLNAILANLQEQPYKNVAGLVSAIQQDMQARN